SLRFHLFRLRRLKEARPARAGFKLRFRIEQRFAAGSSGVDAVLMVIGISARKGTLGAMFAQHAVLLGRELLAPLGIAFDNHVSSFGIGRVSHDANMPPVKLSGQS